MNILIIDDSRDFRALVRLYLSKQLDDVKITEYDIEQLGKPAGDFNWSEYDVLLLDYNLGGNEDGFDWLKEFSSKPGFPPTIILTAEGDEYIAVKAIKLGAADYINKVDVSPKRLADMLVDAAGFTTQRKVMQEEKLVQARQLVHEIHQKHGDKSLKRDVEEGYKFVRLIGQGAMSYVYLAERTVDQLSLVLKVLNIQKVSNQVAVTRFIREAELIAGISSPFVVKIYDHGLTNDYGFIAMEFFSRGDLKQRMELNITPDIAFNYMTHVAYGLDAIHKVGIVHRDLKPANIMFRGDDSLALADFGISKRLNMDSDLTTMGQILGTPHYMSPEQGEGKQVDQRSDLYSVGVMLYELLTRDKPYSANTPAALIYQHVHSPIPRLPKKISRFQEIINRLLAKEPDQRYQTASELIKVLEAAEQGFNQ
ncbi:MAG: protein kinase [Gammaproteobacteria bacterium]|nr:protein kinase [Gammaproteobacteria bacterium]